MSFDRFPIPDRIACITFTIHNPASESLVTSHELTGAPSTTLSMPPTGRHMPASTYLMDVTVMKFMACLFRRTRRTCRTFSD